MAHWVIGDVHGQYYALRALLDKMDIENDEIYFLGDYADWGKYSGKVLKFMSEITKTHKNIHCLIGNHDKMMLDNINNKTKITLTRFGATNWGQNGGISTLRQLYRLSPVERSNIREWLKSLDYYKEININGKNFYLAHAFPYIKSNGKAKARYDTIWRRVKIGEDPFKALGEEYKDYTLICGHTISNRFTHGSFEVFFDKKFIILDCGAKLLHKYPKKARIAAICLEDLQLMYINCLDADNWRWNHMEEWN